MEIVEEGAVMVAKKKGELAIEDYLDFLDDRSLNLTIPQLRQIIGMHGFKRNETKKQLLVDMVTTMDLMDLHRSTLLDAGVSGDACFTLEEVINDLKHLDWQECHVTSLLTLGAVDSASSSSVASDATTSVKRKRPKRLRRKRTEVGAEAEHSDISTGTTVAAESTTESLRSVEV
ncbi:uncharacterized protein LOC105166200 [Sesamum indicum]|uniref:Uncharacterized protein LOC105166200 n=1 Tax=Sesamum indicum TaxID=4182 RepID=A0A6I9TFW1_SESIN|nr:uncharacterized protein LOC105166200 [Sesamum indicum]